MSDSYIILKKCGTGEVTEKKSRFIGQVASCSTEEEAYGFIEKIKKEHYTARHNCFAFSVGRDMPVLRFSDDGEPQGTAGKPILEVIKNSGIINICIVVTRYFGGTLLGTGGLIRAYTDAAKEALSNCETGLIQKLAVCRIICSYNDMGKVQYILNSQNMDIAESEFTDSVTYIVNIPSEQKDRIIKEITDATSARAEIKVEAEVYG